MGRLITFLVFLATPVTAWEFTPVPICTLVSPTENGEVRVTYDPGANLYEIRLTYLGGEVWENAATFGIEFVGTRSLAIGTDRHVISEDGKSLSVTDSGFGNVLDGIEFNSVAQARAGNSAMTMSLAGAAEPLQAFRACGEAALS